MERPKFHFLQNQNLWTDWNKNLAQLITSPKTVHKGTKQIWLRSEQWRLLGEHARYTKSVSADLILFFNQPGSHSPQPTFSRNGLNHVDSRKDVPFAVKKSKLYKSPELTQRWPRDAPYIRVPWTFSGISGHARLTFRPFKVIQSQWLWCQSKARMGLPISLS